YITPHRQQSRARSADRDALVDCQLITGQRDSAGYGEIDRVTIIRVGEGLPQRAETTVGSGDDGYGVCLNCNGGGTDDDGTTCSAQIGHGGSQSGFASHSGESTMKNLTGSAS